MRRAVTVAAVLAGVALAGCGTTVVNNPPPSPSQAQTTQFNAQAVTVAGCRALAQWENGPSTGAEADAHTSQQVQQIIHDSAGTQFSSDLLTWVDDTDPDLAVQDANQVDADCAAAGVPQVIG